MLCPPLKRSQVLQLSRQSCIHYTRAIVLVSGKYLLSYFHLLALMGPITGHVIRNQRFSGAAVKILQISKIITRSLIHSMNLRSIIYRHYVKKKSNCYILLFFAFSFQKTSHQRIHGSHHGPPFEISFFKNIYCKNLLLYTYILIFLKYLIMILIISKNIFQF